MIKFFRKIRQNMIKDNKVSKYLLYAIGEIILVVIGILIALNINNNNTIKKERALEQDYINRLASEMTEEVAYYNDLKGKFENQNAAIIRMLERWKSDTITISDTTQFISDFFAGNGIQPWYKEPVIWTQLVQSGELKLLQNQKLVEALFKHYGQLNRTSENFKGYPTKTTHEGRTLIANTFINESHLATGNSRFELSPETLILILTNKEKYQELFTRVAIITNIHSGVMNGLSTSGNEVLGLLEKAQNSN